MKRKPIILGMLALAVGLIAGSYFGTSTNELWFGGVIGVVVTISSFGLLNSTRMFMMADTSEKPAYILLSSLIVLVIVTPEMSGLFSESHIYAISVYMMGVLLSGATLGVHIAQNTD